MAHTRNWASLTAIPGGLEYYTALVKRYTSTNITPWDIHEVGITEMERIYIKMNKIKEAEGFNGTLQEFREFIKNMNDSYIQDEVCVSYC